MVVWIAWWACVDVLFHILFHTRPPMVVSDVCQCVFHTQITTKHSAVQLVHHPSTLHLANHQRHHAFSACNTHQSIMLLPQLPFILLNVVFFIFTVLVTIERVCGCDGMRHPFAPINTLCVPLWCHPVWPSLCFCALAVVPVVHHAIVLHIHHIWTVDVVEWHPHGFTQSTCHPLHQPLHIVGIKLLANDGFHFKVV